MLATMAGGFMPFIFSNILKPASPQVETKLVSFKSKLEEIIINFCQPWPMDDFVFDIEREPLSESSDSDDDDAGCSSTKSSKCNGRCHHDKGKNGGKKHGDDKKKSGGSDKRSKHEKHNGGVVDVAVDKTDAKVKKPEDDVDVDAIRTVLEELELEPVEGREVDILVYVSEADYEWDLEWSTIDETEPSPSALLPPPITTLYGGSQFGCNHIDDTIV